MGAKLVLDRGEIERLLRYYLSKIGYVEDPLLRERFLSYIRILEYILNNGRKR